MTKFRSVVIGLLMFVSMFAPALSVSQPVYAACNDRMLTFPAWFKGLTNSKCDIKSPKSVGGLQPFIFIIVGNVLEILLQAVAYISVGYILYGGFTYLTVASDANKVARARKMIQNAVIGLVLSIASIGIVNLIAGNIG